MWQEYYSVSNIQEATNLLAQYGEKARIVAGATDLILEMERGVRKGIEVLIDVTRVSGLDQITLDEQDVIHLGPMVTHNACMASKLIVERAFPLAQACWEVGAPQIRNRGTVAGNLITASPANDTITPLMALGAKVSLASAEGQRVVALSDFYTGVRKTVMRPDEMLVDIFFPAMSANQRGAFIKLGLRRAQAISVVNAAVILTFTPGEMSNLENLHIIDSKITLGAVAPTIIFADLAQVHLIERKLDENTMQEAALLAQQAATPIDDVRSSAEYRKEMVRVCVHRGLRHIAAGTERSAFPDDPVLLWGEHTATITQTLPEGIHHNDTVAIDTRINGKDYHFETGQHKTLLHLLREEAGLIGSKEGCSEGECGACTVFLDGLAVMSCLVPAVRAHRAEIVTVEGLADNGHLHPVQSAFVQEGAVQCGYCTPGFLMSAAKLLEEKPHPTRQQIEQAITGNLCRCTGYYKIVKAIELASQ